MVVQQEGTNATVDDLIHELGDMTIKIGWWQTEHPAAGSDVMTWVTFVLLKMLGLGITAAAVSQGSSFWYDLLKKIVSPSKGGGGGSSDGEAKG